MVGRAGRRNFDTSGSIVYYGVSKQKIKNFISSNLTDIHGSYSYSLNLIMQLAVMKTYEKTTALESCKSKALASLKSFLLNPIINLSADEQCASSKLEFREKIIQIQLSYLMSKKLVDSNFEPSNNVKLFLPLRHAVETSSFILSDMMRQGYLYKLFAHLQNDIECMVRNIVLLLCHFIDVRYVNKKQADFLNSTNGSYILPELDGFKEFLTAEHQSLQQYLRYSLDEFNFSEIDMSEVEKAFPHYDSVLNLSKSSYLFDYIMELNMAQTVEKHQVTESRLYYALVSCRTVVAAIQPFVDYNSDLAKAFNTTELKLVEKFKLIVN
jgi:hypothetical protein